MSENPQDVASVKIYAKQQKSWSRITCKAEDTKVVAVIKRYCPQCGSSFHAWEESIECPVCSSIKIPDFFQ